MVVVYSMDPSSDMNIVSMNQAAWIRRDGFVAVSDNGAGDSYGFAVTDGVCGPEVLVLDHESAGISSTGHPDLFEFVVAEGLQP